MIRVVLVDDQTLVREGIKGLLALTKDIAVVAEGSDGEEALILVEREKPDVLIIDVRMPRLSGTAAISRLAKEGRLPPSLVLTTFDDDQALLEVSEAGAKGFLLKDVSLEQLTDAIRTVAGGGRLLQPALTQKLMERVQRREGPKPERGKALSPRELEIIRLMAGGLSNAEIARALGMMEGTVKNHASSILSKLSARDRTQAVLKALELGYA